MGEVDIKDHKIQMTRLLTAPRAICLPSCAVLGSRLVERGPRFSKVYEGEFLVDVANGTPPRFQGESKGLLWLEEELGLQPA